MTDMTFFVQSSPQKSKSNINVLDTFMQVLVDNGALLDDKEFVGTQYTLPSTADIDLTNIFACLREAGLEVEKKPDFHIGTTYEHKDIYAVYKPKP